MSVADAHNPGLSATAEPTDSAATVLVTTADPAPAPDLSAPAGPAATPTVGDAPGLTRREALKLSGLTLGGLAFGGVIAGLVPETAQAENPCGPGDDCCADEPRCDGDCCDDGTSPGCTWTNTAQARRIPTLTGSPGSNPSCRPPHGHLPCSGSIPIRCASP